MGRTKIEEIAERIVNSHGYDEHINEFNNPYQGTVLNINSRDDLKSHVVDVLFNKDTMCFTAFNTEQLWRKADVYYHETTNTFIIIPENIKNEPTIYRPKHGVLKFTEKLIDAELIENREIPVVRGIGELHPELSEQNISLTDKLEPNPESPNKGGIFTKMWVNSQDPYFVDNDHEHNDCIDR